MNRLIIVARLKPDAYAEAKELIGGGPPFDPESAGLERHGVYLTATDVVFVFDGRQVEWTVNDMIDDRFVEIAFERWRPLLDGPARIAHEKYYWSRSEGELGVGLGV